VFIQIKRKIRDNRLRLANLYEHDPTVAAGRVRPQDFAYKGPIVYDDQIRVHRIIHEHLDATNDHDGQMMGSPLRAHRPSSSQPLRHP
jgi:hypothetical protein